MSLRPESMSTGQVQPRRLLQTHLARVLFGAQSDGRTGVLSVDEGPVQTRLHLKSGRVVYASRGPLAETLGRVLMREGVLDRSEYTLILERMAEPSDRDEVLRFGEVAIQLGMLAASELHQALAVQVRHKLMHCFRIDEARWTWEDGVRPWKGPPFATPLEQALRAALRDDPEGDRWTGLLVARRNDLVQLCATPEQLAARFGASSAELRLLKRAQNRPLSMLLSSSTIPPAETAALIVALHLADQLRLRASSSQDQRKPAVEAAKKRRQQRRVASIEKQTQETAQAMSPGARAEEAAAKLRAEMQRRGTAAPTTQHARVEAERAMLKGKGLLDRGNLVSAEEAFDRATMLLPEAAEYLVYRQWCRYGFERDEIARVGVREVLRAACLEALRQDRRFAFGHYVHGRLTEETGDKEAAARAFDIARRLDPELKDAKRRLRLLTSRREE